MKKQSIMNYLKKKMKRKKVHIIKNNFQINY